ncbi:MAG TPA: response regulator, partial [Kofleriaceae bacterium]|nr:response regulator [Kofleriaceae bacterium]
MNRRILLIDADPAFRAALAQQLERYRFEIAAEPDVEQALAQGAAQPPALLMVAVEEPDKAGFKVFQRCKKGPLARVPIVLVTATVSPDSFAKHRGLKVHADDYLDKRALSDGELLGKIDSLVGLGDPAARADDADEIPLSSDDMVLEETIGEDDGEGAEHRVDSMVDAETDAAFAAILDDEPGAAAAPHTKPPHDLPDYAELGTAPTSEQLRASDEDNPAMVDFDTFSRESMRPPVDLIARARQQAAAAAARPRDTGAPIAIDVDDI